MLSWLRRKRRDKPTGCAEADRALAAAEHRHTAAVRREGEIVETVEILKTVDRVNHFALAIRDAFGQPPAPPSPRGAE